MDDKKYLPDGRMVTVIEKLSKGWLVYPACVDENGDTWNDEGSPIMANKLYSEAPKQRYDDNIEKLKKEIQVLKDEKEKLIKSLNDDREFLKEEKASNEERLKKGLRI